MKKNNQKTAKEQLKKLWESNQVLNYISTGDSFWLGDYQKYFLSAKSFIDFEEQYNSKQFLHEVAIKDLSTAFIGNFPKEVIKNIRSTMPEYEFEQELKIQFDLAKNSPDILLGYVFFDIDLSNKDPFNLITENKKELIKICSDNFAHKFVTDLPKPDSIFKKTLPKEDLELMFNRFSEKDACCFYNNNRYDCVELRNFWEKIDSNRFYHLLERGFNVNESVDCLASLDNRYLNPVLGDKIARKISLNGKQSLSVLEGVPSPKLALLGRDNINLLDASATNYVTIKQVIDKYRS